MTIEPDEGPEVVVQAGEFVIRADGTLTHGGELHALDHDLLNDAAEIGYRKGLEDAVRDFREACSKADQREEDDPRLKYVNVQLDKEVYFLLWPKEG